MKMWFTNPRRIFQHTRGIGTLPLLIGMGNVMVKCGASDGGRESTIACSFGVNE